MNISRALKINGWEICARNGAKMIDGIVRPFFPFEVAKNSKFNLYKVFLTMLLVPLTNGTTESVNRYMTSRILKPQASGTVKRKQIKGVMTGRTLRNYLHTFTIDDLTFMFGEMFRLINLEAKKRRLFDHPILVSIDPNRIPVYFKRSNRDIHVVGCKRKASTNYANGFVPIDIVQNGMRLTIGLVHMSIFTNLPELAKTLLSGAKEWAKIDSALLDREFFSVDVIAMLMQFCISFIIPAKDTEEIKRLKKQYRNQLPCSVKYTMTSKDGRQVTMNLLLLKDEKTGRIHGYITNMDIDPEVASEIYDSR